MGNIFINYFPFSIEAAAHLKNQGIDIKTLPKDFPLLFEEAFKRLKNLMDKDKKRLPDEIDTTHPANEVILYAIMRVFIELLDEDLLRNRLALAYSERTEKILFSSDQSFLTNLASKTFNWQIRKEEPYNEKINKWFLKLNNFLEVAPNFIANDWKLINQNLQDGWVLLRNEKLIRLLAEKTKMYIAGRKKTREEMPEVSEDYDSFLNELKSKIGLLRKNFLNQEVYSDEIKQSAYPPCIKFILGKTEKGVNLAHNERLFLTMFLLNTGSSIDDVMKIFTSQPDFKEEMTRYQVEFAAGKRGSGTKYTSFGCPKLISYGLCKKELDQTDLCIKGKVSLNKDLKNPLQYYRNRIYYSKKEQKIN